MTHPAPDHLPDEGLWLAYYGDDFTGSTDVLEAFTAAGVPTVLFLQPPRPQDLARFPDVRCVGVAGQSRGKSPAWMRAALPEVFERLSALGAPIVQYKVCSTFDSSPEVGSIGQAIDLGVQHTHAHWSPMVVGAPRLQRYQVFGHLFAAAQGEVWRIDRHPTMSRHPVTPMHESDLRVHLAQQTPRRIGLVNLAQMTQGQADDIRQGLQGPDQPVVMLDVADTLSQREAGRLVWQQRGQGVFSASSSGLQYALTEYWRSCGWLTAQPSLPQAQAQTCIAVVSGSCSPMSAAQIDWAEKHGFLTERLDVAKCLDPVQMEEEIVRLVTLATDAVARDVSPLIYSARGPDDPAVQGFDAWVRRAACDKTQASERIGMALAEVMRRLLDRTALRRIVVAGGDSSGAVASHLGVQALTVCAGMAPGVPLCRVWSDNPHRDGLEMALKGGQLGAPSFYGDVRAGRVG
ncbi:3-oxo-isoapionate kinase OiaK [Limnohabitans parvus]|uniref:Type III effector n=1 Tax=Limnohabitans parvus II-B4 TaxID=1293052 RepID=A0A315E9N6_9BURK|nr:3-oxo-isoapionate kinase OiaK [Limnohabitans parvus]PUE54403.1 type III effector [Limnohabitans parvus II-B4]